jgi:Zn-dependent peptidase ImmA (M78 family)
MVHLLEAHGVRVFSLVQDCLTVDAFSFWRGNIPYVFLNSNKSAEHGRMDAAHELAHLVLHAHGGPTGRAAEHEAQAFASAFLMPERSVRAALRPGLTARQIIKAKRKWNVSAMGLTHRLERLDLLSEWQARTAYIQLTNLGYRKAEPDGIEREASQILPKVFAALRSEGVSRTDVARELNVPMDEISRVTFGLTVATGADARAGAGLPPAPGPSGAKPDLHVVAS